MKHINKVESFTSYSIQQLTNSINVFIRNIDVISISHAQNEEGMRIYYTALVLYKEKIKTK